MGKIFYDIIPPNVNNVKIKPRPLRKSIERIVALALIIGVSWAGISSIYKTRAYFSDVEESKINYFSSGAVDFQLNSAQVFSSMVLSPGASATGTISVINFYNVPKYKIKTDNFSGALCEYLNLEANLDGGDAEYSGKLNLFDLGPTIFESPDDWFFTLALPASTTDFLIGETCNFNFVFYGSQVKNDLPFGQGFSDTEDASSSIKAKMCFDSEIKSKGYWKNHLDVAKPYLPQMLGNEIISSTSSAYKVLDTDYSLSTRNKLKGQLLAVKLDVAHFGIGDYIPTSTASSVIQVTTEADNLLKATSTPPDSVLEEMKDLLESIAQDLSVRACTETGVKVLIPNGGEKWWVGKYYDLTWETKNFNCPNDLTQISVWYSKDSGTTWGNIATSTQNDGVYNWRIPLFLENNTYYIPSDKARIKVVAVCSENLMVAGWDTSDYDFCPPIEEDLLTPEELELARALGLIPQEIITVITEEVVANTTTSEQIVIGGVFDKEQIITEENALTTEDVSTSTEEISTTTEEILDIAEEPSATAEEASTTTENQSEGGIIDSTNDTIDNMVNEIVEVLISDSITTETTENTATTENEEIAVIIQSPAVVEQPVIVPESNPTEPDPVLDESSGNTEGTSE